MAVRNGVLGRVHLSVGGLSLLFTCPAGKTAIVKSVAAINSGTLPHEIGAFMLSADTTVNGNLAVWTGAVNTHYEWQGFACLGPGDQLWGYAVATEGGGVHIWASGAVLAGVIT